MDKSEVMEMGKLFYSNYYLDAFDEDDTDWLDSDIHLSYGDKDISIKLRISDYYRIAKEIDTQRNNNKFKYQLTSDTLHLLVDFASPSIGEKLTEKLLVVESVNKPVQSSNAGANRAGGGLIDMMSNMMSGLSKMTENSGPAFKDMLNNPQAKSIVDNITNILPAEMQSTMSTLVNDLSSGTMDISKTMSNIVESAQKASAASASTTTTTTTTIESGSSSSDVTTLIDISTDTDDNSHCVDGVCYIQH